MLPYESRLKPLARRLRKEMTEGEQHLWSRLRRKQLLGVQFYRQKPLGRYIVDFHAPAVRLVIEIDGSQHMEPGHTAADHARDDWLRAQGLRVLRFESSDVLRNTEGVMEVIFTQIRKALEKSPLTPFRKGRCPSGMPVSTEPRPEHRLVPPFEKGGRRGEFQ